jgi:hypothetical protein
MTPSAILKATAADGVTLALSSSGAIKAAGERAAVACWLPTIKENKASIVEFLAKVSPGDTATASYCWLIHFSDRDPLEVAFSPAVSHDEVLAGYPSALAAEPAVEIRQFPDALLTGAQEDAIVAWLAQIGESDEAIVGEVLAQCRHDEDARQYFLGRAGECATADTEERRRCDQCANLAGR